MPNRKQKPLEDDGRAVANMDFEGTHWSRQRYAGTPSRYTEHKKQFIELNLTRKERRAMIFGALSAVFPIAAAFLILYFLAFLLVDLIWLH